MLNVLDDEAWPYADEKKSMSLANQGSYYVHFGQLVDGPRKSAEVCAGDEVRVELYPSHACGPSDVPLLDETIGANLRRAALPRARATTAGLPPWGGDHAVS